MVGSMLPAPQHVGHPHPFVSSAAPPTNLFCAWGQSQTSRPARAQSAAMSPRGTRRSLEEDDDDIGADVEEGSSSAHDGDDLDEGEDAGENESTIGGPASGSTKSSVTSKAKAKAKSRGGKANPSSASGRGGNRGGGRPNKVKAGMKWCGACNKTLGIELFPVGSAFCHADRQAVQNLAYASKTQSQLGWWESVKNNPKKLQKVVKYYHDNCGRSPADGKRKATFKVAAYEEYVRQEDRAHSPSSFRRLHLIRPCVCAASHISS